MELLLCFRQLFAAYADMYMRASSSDQNSQLNCFGISEKNLLMFFFLLRKQILSSLVLKDDFFLFSVLRKKLFWLFITENSEQ